MSFSFSRDPFLVVPLCRVASPCRGVSPNKSCAHASSVSAPLAAEGSIRWEMPWKFSLLIWFLRSRAQDTADFHEMDVWICGCVDFVSEWSICRLASWSVTGLPVSVFWCDRLAFSVVPVCRLAFSGVTGLPVTDLSVNVPWSVRLSVKDGDLTG